MSGVEFTQRDGYLHDIVDTPYHRMTRQSKVHFSVCDVEESTVHQLIPLLSEKKIQQSPNTEVTPDTGRPTQSGIYEAHFTNQSSCMSTADSGFESISEEVDSSTDSTDESSVEEMSFTMTNLQQSNYSESVSFSVLPKTARSRCLSQSAYQSHSKNREGIVFGPGLKPVRYQNNMIVYNDSTRKRYKSVVHYETKIKPVGFSSTCFIFPAHKVETYVSLLDYRTDTDRKWYQCTLVMRPKTYSYSKVNCFEMNNNQLDSDGEEIEDYENEQCSNSIFDEEDGVGNPYVVNAKVWNFSDAKTAPRSYQESFESPDVPQNKRRHYSDISESYSTKYVVHSRMRDPKAELETHSHVPRHYSSLPEYDYYKNNSDQTGETNINNSGNNNISYPKITNGNLEDSVDYTDTNHNHITGQENTYNHLHPSTAQHIQHNDVFNNSTKEQLDEYIMDEDSDDSECYINDDMMAKTDGDLFKGYSGYAHINDYGGSASSLAEIDL